MLREVILTVLAHRPMTGYEISRSFDQVLSHFWRASHQQIYRELARLNADGWVVFREMTDAGKPTKKLYSLTKEGRGQLQKWVGEPTPPPRPQYDLLVKVLAGFMVNKPALEREITRVHGETTAYLKQLRSIHRRCLSQPLETGYDFALYLALRRGLLLVEAQLAWLGEVRGFLGGGEIKRNRRATYAQAHTARRKRARVSHD